CAAWCRSCVGGGGGADLQLGFLLAAGGGAYVAGRLGGPGGAPLPGLGFGRPDGNALFMVTIVEHPDRQGAGGRGGGGGGGGGWGGGGGGIAVTAHRGPPARDAAGAGGGQCGGRDVYGGGGGSRGPGLHRGRRSGVCRVSGAAARPRRRRVAGLARCDQ